MQITKSKYSINFLIFNLRRIIIPSIFCTFTICLVLFSNSNLIAAKNGLNLWANSVVPSLLPFFIATELLSHTNVVGYLGRLFNTFMRPVFNISGIGAFAFIMGIISGYPVGAKIATQLRLENKCTQEEAERLVSFTNNSGPLFIIGTVGILLFGNSIIGILLFITHILGSITVGIVFRYWKNNKSTNSYNKFVFDYSKEVTFANLGEVLYNSIFNSIKTIVMIGGFVVLFSVIISTLNEAKFFQLCLNIFSPICNLFNISSKFIVPFISGLIELTNGVSLISNIPNKAISINIILTSFLLGFGGLSILLQVFSIISKSDISIKPYILGKLLHGLLSSFYTFLILQLPVFNFDIILSNL